MRDSLREEISQNLNENLTEHEVITETIIQNDSVKVERVTDRVTIRGRLAKTEAKKEEVRIVRDTVYLEQRDSVQVQEIASLTRNEGSGARASPFVSALKWLVALIVAVIVLIIVIRVALWLKN